MRTSRPTAALLARHAPAAQAIATLLHPHAEVVLHELRNRRIAGIWNAWSGREPGDDSLLDDDENTAYEQPVLGPYDKYDGRGRRIKSVTAVLRDESGTATALLCINLDISHFAAAAQLLQAFVDTPAPRPALLFAKDWREQIQLQLHDWLSARNLSAAALPRHRTPGPADRCLARFRL
jgi:predicted transcriptional regulator YheO